MKKSHRKAVLCLTIAIAVICLLIPGNAPTAYLNLGIPSDYAVEGSNSRAATSAAPIRGPEAEPLNLMLFGLGLLGFSMVFNRHHEKYQTKSNA